MPWLSSPHPKAPKRHYRCDLLCGWFLDVGVGLRVVPSETIVNGRPPGLEIHLNETTCWVDSYVATHYKRKYVRIPTTPLLQATQVYLRDSLCLTRSVTIQSRTFFGWVIGLHTN
jgi:hypothetical protein